MYKVNNIVRSGHPVPLNQDHTHFLLVDDGYRGRYGGVAEFRASLERKLSLPQGTGEECPEGNHVQSRVLADVGRHQVLWISKRRVRDSNCRLFLSWPLLDVGLGIPVVLVVVEGGYDAILDCRKSLSQKIPVIICEGTGRAADIIAYAYTHFITTRK